MSNSPNARETTLTNVETNKVRVFETIISACYFLRCSTFALRNAEEKGRPIRARNGTNWMVTFAPAKGDATTKVTSDGKAV